MVAHYHVRPFFCPVIFFFFYTWVCYSRNTCTILIFKITFLCSFLCQVKSIKCNTWDWAKCSASYHPFFPKTFPLSLYSSSFPFFLLSFFRMLSHYLTFCSSVWLCIQIILKLPSLFNGSCFDSIKILFFFFLNEMVYSRKEQFWSLNLLYLIQTALFSYKEISQETWFSLLYL